jgi:hypothetical protein
MYYAMYVNCQLIVLVCETRSVNMSWNCQGERSIAHNADCLRSQDVQR